MNVNRVGLVGGLGSAIKRIALVVCVVVTFGQTAGAFQQGVVTPKHDAIILAYIKSRWYPKDNWFEFIPTRYLIKVGMKRRVDHRLGNLVNVASNQFSLNIKQGYPAYGAKFPYVARFYRDKNGIRLIYLGVEANEQLVILSAISRHSGRKVNQNWSLLHTESDIRLGTLEKAIYSALGKPSEIGRLGNYKILFYFGKAHYVHYLSGRPYYEGEWSSYVTKNGQVVELCLDNWNNWIHG